MKNGALLKKVGNTIGILIVIPLLMIGSLALAGIIVWGGAWLFALSFLHGQMPPNSTLSTLFWIVWVPFGIYIALPILPPRLFWYIGHTLRVCFIGTESRATIPAKSSLTITGLLGAVSGVVAYHVYSHIWQTGTLPNLSVGWIFFFPQYLCSWCSSVFDMSRFGDAALRYAIISLFYAYIFLCLRILRPLALTTIVFSAILFVCFVPFQSTQNTLTGVARLAFWPAALLRDQFNVSGVANHFIRVLLEATTVSFWYAAAICGVRLPLLLSKTRRTPQPDPVYKVTTTRFDD